MGRWGDGGMGGWVVGSGVGFNRVGIGSVLESGHWGVR
jgi:hypothetical protein